MSWDKSTQRRHWQLNWRLLVFAGSLLPILLALGFWQLDRAGQKQAKLVRWQQQVEHLNWSEHLQQGLEEGQPVVLSGHYSDTLHWLLDNRTRQGVPGYEVLSVFIPSQGRPVVINRGWIPGRRQREELPRINTPEPMVTIRGRIGEFPQPPVLASSPVEPSWPRRVQTLAPDEARAQARIPALAGQVIRLSGSTQPGAFEADWPPDLMSPQRHYGYATQWFSLAGALVLLTLFASYRKTETGHD